MSTKTTVQRLTQANQEDIVRDHLVRLGSITGVEADAVYKIRWLPTRIKALRDAGYVITSTWKKDATGQRYVRYTLLSVPQTGQVFEAA